MQFAVPQFIEVESKVIGPISVRQFIILLATAGIAFVEYELFNTVVFVILAIFTCALGVIFAFAKVNSQPFHVFILSVVQTLKRPKLSVWQHEVNRFIVEKTPRKDKTSNQAGPVTPKVEPTSSELAELSLIMDTGGKYTPYAPTSKKN